MNQGADTEPGMNTRRPQSKENEFTWKGLTLFFCFGLLGLLVLSREIPPIHNRGYDHWFGLITNVAIVFVLP